MSNQFSFSLNESRLHTYKWHLTKGVHTPDGVEWELIPVNGQLPAPNIFGHKGDRIEIAVVNELDEPTTIHWHVYTKEQQT